MKGKYKIQKYYFISFSEINSLKEQRFDCDVIDIHPIEWHINTHDSYSYYHGHEVSLIQWEQVSKERFDEFKKFKELGFNEFRRWKKENKS